LLRRQRDRRGQHHGCGGVATMTGRSVCLITMTPAPPSRLGPPSRSPEEPPGGAHQLQRRYSRSGQPNELHIAPRPKTSVRMVFVMAIRPASVTKNAPPLSPIAQRLGSSRCSALCAATICLSDDRYRTGRSEYAPPSNQPLNHPPAV
jgi:hypothetical protein